MGLAFIESNAQWSYSGFNNFRRRLATQIGINLDAMQGFGGTIGDALESANARTEARSPQP